MNGWARAVGACALLLAACQADGRDGGRAAKPVPAPPSPPERRVVTDVTAEGYQGPALPRAKVVVHDAFGGRHVVEVEVAATEPSRTRGLMWRRELADGQGMLFLFPDEEVRGFWMRNTLIPLDMLFIRSDGVIAGVVPEAAPKTLDSRSVGRPSQYVLEVPGGWCQRNGVGPGQRVEFHGVSAIEIQ